jgi:hypothetical protein
MKTMITDRLIECTAVQIQEVPVDSPTPEEAPISKRGVCA